MSKISFNTEDQEVEITRSIGKNGDGKITIDREGGGAIEINLGIASIGITTDYGGAISLGIAGQEVTWGKEGGTIHIGVGGFAVDVEARDCIVTETKSIFGQIVAQRSYPDPGCKKEKEEDKPPEPPFVPQGGIKLEDGVENVFVILQGSRTGINRTGNPPGSWYVDTSVSEHKVSVSGVPESVVFSNGKAPFTVSETYVANRIQQAVAGQTVGGAKVRTLNISCSGQTTNFSMTYLPYGQIYEGRIANYSSQVEATADGIPCPPWSSILVTPAKVLYGSKTNCKQYISTQLNPTAKDTASETTFQEYVIIRVISLGKQLKPRPFLPTGNKPPMNSCCEEVLDELADLKEALGVERLLKDKFPVSNTFMAPECDPASVTEAKTYYEIFQCLLRMLAHGMIFEPRVSIKDADAAKAGDQELKTRYLNATGWASAVSEALMEVKDDGNVSTNMDIRSGFASTQTMVGMADAIYRLDAILDCMGITLMPKVETVETPYNVQIQIGKGFGKGNERQIDLNTDEATEKLLPSFLQTKKNKIKTVAIHPRSRTLHEILENIEASLPTNNNG